MRFILRSFTALFLLALTAGLLALAALTLRDALAERLARAAAPRPGAERVYAVHVLTAEEVTATPRIESFGEIRSGRTLDLRVPVGGTIVVLSPHFVEGGEVARGERLLKLDPSDARTALDVARTDLEEAAAELDDARAARVLAEDELAAAREQVRLRQSAHRRQLDLRARGVGTEAAVETAALALASAGQAVLAKRQALAQATTRVSRAGTSLARQEIRRADAERRLRDTELFAEFGGVLGSVSVVEGGRIGPNERVARLIDPAALEVAFRVSNTQFARLAAGSDAALGGSVRVRLDVFGEDVTANGSIRRVSAEVGSGQTGRQIFAALDEGSGKWFRPGDFVTVEAHEPPIERAVVVPALAVGPDDTVLVLGENDRLEKVGVEVARRQGDEVILRAPAIVGREIVAARSPYLGAGIRVKPVRMGAAPPPVAPDMVTLTPERRARLIAFIEGNPNIPDFAKQRIVARLKRDKVPSRMVERIESRMGG